MPLTMLRQMARHGRLEAKLKDEQLSGGLAGQLAEILQPGIAASTKANQPLSEQQVAKILKEAKDLEEEDYHMLLEYQTSKGQLWHAYNQVPLHIRNPLVLPPCALKPKEFKLGEQDFGCYKSNRGTCNIQFRDPASQSILTGIIDEIWQMPLENHMQTFIMVQKHKLLPPELLQKTPFPSFPLFKATAVYARHSNQFCLIEPGHIITHLTVDKPPTGTWGIQQKLMIICWALNRGRR